MIDFEAKFRDYLHGYKKKNKLKDDELDAIAPELYLKWLDSPKNWLDGKSPIAHFKAFDAAALIEQLSSYIISDVTLPGVLMNQITDSKKETYPYLLSLLKNYIGDKYDDVKITIIRLIEEIDMPHPYDYYIEVIVDSDEKSDFAEACVQELKNAGSDYIKSLIRAYEQSKNRYVSDCFLDVLCDVSNDARVFQVALEKFLYSETGKAFYASCLGKIGNEKAISYLEEELRNDDIGYYDYTAIKNALEELGGEIDIERDFSGDSDYESLKNLEE